MNWKPLKVLFVGDQPSSKNVSKDVPFVGTPSYKRLLRWIGELDLDIKNVKIANKVDYERSGLNGVLYTSNYDVIIFLGKNSECSVLTYAYNPCPKFKTIDHPSPRNRKFNEPKYEREMIKNLKEWLYAG